jgi:2-oxoglutarate ferredoxin oxidoreductase subunit alpha
MPTKVEQSDLLQAIFGRNGDAPVPVIACSRPSDCFELTIEACRIAVQYMTPVIILSDNFIANGAEPWCLPNLDDIKEFPVTFATNPEGHQTFARDEKGSRPWAVPGSPGMEFRIGGLEKDIDGNISYDAQNHQAMTDQRHNKIAAIAETIPTPAIDGPESGDLLVLGWGSTVGILTQSVITARENGKTVSRMHLTHIWPFPKGLDEIFSKFKAILIPEMNMGQLTRVLRGELPQHNYIPYTKVTGQPFLTSEVVAKINNILEG